MASPSACCFFSVARAVNSGSFPLSVRAQNTRATARPRRLVLATLVPSIAVEAKSNIVVPMANCDAALRSRATAPQYVAGKSLASFSSAS